MHEKCNVSRYGVVGVGWDRCGDLFAMVASSFVHFLSCIRAVHLAHLRVDLLWLRSGTRPCEWLPTAIESKS